MSVTIERNGYQLSFEKHRIGGVANTEQETVDRLLAEIDELTQVLVALTQQHNKLTVAFMHEQNRDATA